MSFRRVESGSLHVRSNTVEVKPRLNRTIIGLLKEKIRAGIGKWLLVTRYVAAGQADELRAMNLAFLDTVTLYAAKQPNELIIRQKLRKDPEGDVEILKRFWSFGKPNVREDVVPPLLVYADLLATGDDRNFETAQMIYEQYIAGLIKEG